MRSLLSIAGRRTALHLLKATCRRFWWVSLSRCVQYELSSYQPLAHGAKDVVCLRKYNPKARFDTPAATFATALPRPLLASQSSWRLEAMYVVVEAAVALHTSFSTASSFSRTSMSDELFRKNKIGSCISDQHSPDAKMFLERYESHDCLRFSSRPCCVGHKPYPRSPSWVSAWRLVPLAHVHAAVRKSPSCFKTGIADYTEVEDTVRRRSMEVDNGRDQPDQTIAANIDDILGKRTDEVRWRTSGRRAGLQEARVGCVYWLMQDLSSPVCKGNM